MFSEPRRQKGLSLIEIAMVIILSVFFISGGVYVISLFKVFAQSYVTASDMNSIRSIIDNADIKYAQGSNKDASSITNEQRYNKYKVYFGGDGYTLISSSTPVSEDIFFITCYLAKYNCVWIVGNKAQHMSEVLPPVVLSELGFSYQYQGGGVTGILFKRY